VLHKSEMWRGANSERRVVMLTTETESDLFDKEWHDERKRFTVYDVSASGKRTVFRQFTKDSHGVILEVFENIKSTKEHKSIFENSDDEEEKEKEKKEKEAKAAADKAAAAASNTTTTTSASSKKAAKILENAQTPSVAALAAQQLESELAASNANNNASSKSSPRSRSGKNVPALATSTPPGEIAVNPQITTTPSAVTLSAKGAAGAQHQLDESASRTSSAKPSPRPFFPALASNKIVPVGASVAASYRATGTNRSDAEIDAEQAGIAAMAGTSMTVGEVPDEYGGTASGLTHLRSTKGRSGKAGPSSSFADGAL
jgi:hypothetical protein